MTIVFLAALGVHFFKKVWLRYSLLAGVVIFFGYVWTVEFTFFHLGIIFGGRFAGVSIFTLVFIGLVLLTVIFFNRLYCFHLCPFGALTELLYVIRTRLIKLKNIKLSNKFLPEVRYIFTASVITYAVFTNNFNLEFEPHFFIFLKNFNIFLIIFSGLIIFASLFVKRIWCRYFCPCGLFFDLIIKMKYSVKKYFK